MLNRDYLNEFHLCCVFDCCNSLRSSKTGSPLLWCILLRRITHRLLTNILSVSAPWNKVSKPRKVVTAFSLKLDSLILFSNLHRRWGLSNLEGNLGLSFSHQDLQQWDCLSLPSWKESLKRALFLLTSLLYTEAADRGAGVTGTRAIGLESPISSFHVSHVAFRQKSGAKCLPITWSKLLHSLLPKFWARFWLLPDI